MENQAMEHQAMGNMTGEKHTKGIFLLHLASRCCHLARFILFHLHGTCKDEDKQALAYEHAELDLASMDLLDNELRNEASPPRLEPWA